MSPVSPEYRLQLDEKSTRELGADWNPEIGIYSFIFKSLHYPNESVACKHGSPLLLGIKELTEDWKSTKFPKIVNYFHKGMIEVEDSGSVVKFGKNTGYPMNMWQQEECIKETNT